MNVIENKAYYRLLRMYAGQVKQAELIDESTSDLDRATLMYGLGVWHLYNGDVRKARSIFKKILKGPYWPAFGYIAAEAHMAKFMADISKTMIPG